MMEGYLLKSSVCLIVLYVMYRLILKNDVNHQLKRFIGLTCLVFACVYLFIPLGSLLIADTYPEVIHVVFMQGSEGLQEGISQVITEDVTNVYLAIYFMGVSVFALRSLFGFFLLIYWYFTSKKYQKWGFTVVEVKRKMTPFTFFNLLFTGEVALNDQEMKALIVHEQYHREQWHSIDTVLLEILTVVFWFNPAIWLFRKDIKTVHEYMADAQVLKRGFNILQYQQLLFHTKTGMTLTLGSHFSTKTNLKKRISMMNQKSKKSKYSYHKGLLFVPIMAAILVLSAFTTANYNLSQEIQLLREQTNRDTVPSQEELEREKLQFRIQQALSEKDTKQPLYILKEGKKEKEVSFAYVKKHKYSEITTVYVLKDEAAREKYGKKGKNGVVVFEIKKKKNESQE